MGRGENSREVQNGGMKESLWSSSVQRNHKICKKWDSILVSKGKVEREPFYLFMQKKSWQMFSEIEYNLFDHFIIS